MGLPRSPAAHLDLGPGIFPLQLRGHHYPSMPSSRLLASRLYIAAADITRYVQVSSAHDAGRNAQVASFTPGGMLRVSTKVIGTQRYAGDGESLADELTRGIFHFRLKRAHFSRQAVVGLWLQGSHVSLSDPQSDLT